MVKLFGRKDSALEKRVEETDKKLRDALGVLAHKAATADISGFARMLEVMGSDLTGDHAKLETGAGKIWATFRSCHLVGHRISSAAWHTDEERPSALGKELLALLNKPNDYLSFPEMLYLTAFHLKLTGKAYWLKDNPNLKGKPEKIWPLYPQFVKPRWDKDLGIVGFEYKMNGVTTYFDKEEVIYFKRPHPVIPNGALGEVEGGKEVMVEYMDKAEFKERFIRNGAQPSGVLIRKEAEENDTKWQKFKSWFNDNYGGKENAGKVAFLSGEWQYLKLGVGLNDLADVAREKQNIGFIFLSHGVPLSVAGLEKAANLAVSFQDELNFRAYECVPLLDMIIRGVNDSMSATYGGVTLVYALDGLIDVAKIMSDFTPLVDRGGMTLNELREKAGLPKGKHPALDQYITSAGRVPLEFLGFSSPAVEGQIKELAEQRNKAARDYLLDINGAEDGDDEEVEALRKELAKAQSTAKEAAQKYQDQKEELEKLRKKK